MDRGQKQLKYLYGIFNNKGKIPIVTRKQILIIAHYFQTDDCLHTVNEYFLILTF